MQLALEAGSPEYRDSGQRQLEDISFTFGAIEIQRVPGKTMAADQMGLR